MTMRLAGLFLVLLLLSGCAAGPDYVRPELEADLPSQWARLSLVETLPTPGEAHHWRWWQAFGDTTLDGLVESALLHNNDLAAAAGRVLEARALAGGAESARWPSLEIGGSASRSKISTTQTFGFMDPYRNAFAANANLRYEVDLWGRLSRGKEAATATLLASEEDRRAVAQAVIAGVVRSWLQIQELEMQVALNARTVANFSRNQTFVRSRYERGLVTSLDVHLASQNLASAQAQGPVLQQNLAQAKRQLEILVGRFPAGAIVTTEALPTTLPDPLPPVPAGLPSQLLERRPDLSAAEMRLRASVARIGEAKAALYPRISLTGSAGSSSTELSDLFTKPTNIWSLAGNLVMPLINRGATKAQIKAAEARAQQAVASYRTAVLQAFAEVENALDQDAHQTAQEEFLKDSVLQARRAVARAEERYGQGLDNILVTLETQRRLYTAEANYLTTQRLRRTARVNLIQALGGPWDVLENPHTAQNTQGASQ